VAINRHLDLLHSPFHFGAREIPFPRVDRDEFAAGVVGNSRAFPAASPW
jgi:hypothetical protein